MDVAGKTKLVGFIQDEHGMVKGQFQYQGIHKSYLDRRLKKIEEKESCQEAYVWANVQVVELSKAGSAMDFEIYHGKEKLGR